MAPFRLRLMIRIFISPILIILISGRKLLDAWLFPFRHLHYLDIFLHVDGIRLPEIGQLVEVDTLFVDGPEPHCQLYDGWLNERDGGLTCPGKDILESQPSAEA